MLLLLVSRNFYPLNLDIMLYSGRAVPFAFSNSFQLQRIMRKWLVKTRENPGYSITAERVKKLALQLINPQYVLDK